MPSMTLKQNIHGSKEQKNIRNNLDNEKIKKVGVIVDDIGVDGIMHDFIIGSKQNNFFTIESLIVQKTFKSKSIISLLREFYKQRGTRRLLRDIFFKFINTVEGFILSKVINDKEFFKNKIDSYEINRINVEPKISDSGFVFEYRTEDLNMIRRLNLDVLIRGGSGILKGDILKITNHGVFSFHHGDHKKNRGGPPAFWEVFNEEDSTGFIIQKLGDDLDNGDIYYSGSVATSFLHTLNFYRIVKKSNIFLIKLLEKLSKGEDNPRKRDINLYSEVLFTVPSIRQQLVYVAKKSMKLLRGCYLNYLK